MIIQNVGKSRWMGVIHVLTTGWEFVEVRRPWAQTAETEQTHR
jgi:hypothetical protein